MIGREHEEQQGRRFETCHPLGFNKGESEKGLSQVQSSGRRLLAYETSRADMSIKRTTSKYTDIE